jgi:hypothetical protein
MDLSHKIVNKIPLDCLWTESILLEAKRIKYLNQQEVSEILKNGPIRFVIANVGDKLIWTDLEKSFEIYKTGIKDVIISDIDKINLDSLTYGFGYLASLWAEPSKKSIILLEKFH